MFAVPVSVDEFLDFFAVVVLERFFDLVFAWIQYVHFQNRSRLDLAGCRSIGFLGWLALTSGLAVVSVIFAFRHCLVSGLEKSLSPTDVNLIKMSYLLGLN